MPGEFLPLSDADYYGDIARWSGSFLDRVERDPREAKAMIEGKPEKPATDPMRLGKYVHALALEGPEVAAQRIALPPSQHYAYRALTPKQRDQYDAYVGLSAEARAVADHFRGEGAPEQKRLLERPGTKALIALVGKKRIVRKLQDPSPGGEGKTMARLGDENKRLWSEFVESAVGRTIVKLEQVPTATAMVKAIKAHPMASKLLSKGRPEQSMHWTCPHTGVPMKGRLDWLTANDELVELKCTHLVSPDNINLWLSSGWARKAAIYLDGYKAIRGKPGRMWWIFVEMTGDEPLVHTCWVTEDHLFVRAGRDGHRQHRGYINLIEWAQTCKSTGDWVHPWQLIQDASMAVPDWMETQMVNDEKLDRGHGSFPDIPVIGGVPLEDYGG